MHSSNPYCLTVAWKVPASLSINNDNHNDIINPYGESVKAIPVCTATAPLEIRTTILASISSIGGYVTLHFKVYVTDISHSVPCEEYFRERPIKTPSKTALNQDQTLLIFLPYSDDSNMPWHAHSLAE